MTDLQQLLDVADTIGVLAALNDGSISSVELLNAQLDRIDTYNPSVNAVVAFDIEGATAEAEACDAERAAGTSRGPLHGLTMTVKDTYETVGMVTTAGSPTLADHLAESDADLVKALRDAGAIIYGKTNTPLFAGDHQTDNEVYGLTRNPWHPDHTVGGSSGGSAAALACGFTTAEIGSDIGGSIRVPAHFNGVFGLKPTFGVMSQRGHVPPTPGALAAGDLSVTGPMGRSVADLKLLTEVLTKVGSFDGIPGAELPKPDGAVNLAELRVGLWSDDELAPVAADVKALVEGVGSALSDAGAEVRSDLRPSVPAAELHATYLDLLLAVMASGFPPELFESLSQRDDQNSRRSTVRHRDWMKADERRAKAIASWDELLHEVDVMIAPVTQTPAFPHNLDESYYRRVVDVDGVDRPYDELLFWAGIVTMPGLPAVTIPVGLVDGRPVGVQIIGRRWSDLTLLAQAEQISAVAGSGFVAPPLVTG